MDEDLDTVIVEYDEDTGIGRLTLDRPESLNALNEQLMTEIVEGLERLEGTNADAEGVALRAVVIDGAGEKAFCAGADVEGFSSSPTGGTSDRTAAELLREYPAPVIAEIQGFCLGGGWELAFACDFRIASADSTFGLPEVGIGIVPGGGAMQYVSRLANPAVAKELVMTGKHVSANRALEEGLVHETVEPEELDDRVEEFADELASQAPLAVQAAKDAIDNTMRSGFDAGLEYDNTLAQTLLSTEDAEEGAKAFAEDREPEFVGK